MQRYGFTEADWKLFRERLPEWQESFMARLNDEYAELLSGRGPASEKFWALERRIAKDKRKAGVIVEMRRSRMLSAIHSLLREGAITDDDLEGFSDDMRELFASIDKCSSPR